MNAEQDTVSDVRTITQRLTQAGIHRDSLRSDDDGHVPIHERSDSLLSEAQRDVIRVVGGERGATLRRTLIRNAAALQGTRTDADRTAAAMRLDVKEYLSLLEGRFAREFKDIGRELGRRLKRDRPSHIRVLRG